MRLRWLPSLGTPAAAGYLVYVRRADAGVYPPPRDAGLPALAADGTLQHVVEALDRGTSYTVSVSAYAADGSEGGRSNEITLPARVGPCAFQPEQAICDAGDRCIPGGCSGGACVLAGGAMLAPGMALHARLVARRRELVGEAAFVTLGGLAPDVAGAAVEVVGADGALVYRADVPPGTFRVRARRQVFRHVAHGAPADGLRRLVLRCRGDVLQVAFRALVPDALAGATEPLTWVVHVGATCVRQVELRCDARGRGRRCS